jgi:hypothetical protein
MSNFLAVGAVTAVLRGLIEASVGRHGLSSVLGGPPEVSALPPDRIQTGQGTPDRINLFLFQATENPAWRNMDYPARNGRGDRLMNSKLALDLHYLLTAYGSADFRAEVLLGHGMFVFHETPVLTRQDIRDVLAALTPGPLADALGESRLADQFEQIKIAPRVLNVEEVSKIWTALQSQYRTTAAYQVTVVLIEAEQPGRSPLPVLTRGQPIPALGRDEGVFVHLGLLPPEPTLERLELPFGAPSIELGEPFVLRGHHLAGNLPRARFRLVRGTTVWDLAALPGASESGFSVAMPQDPPPPGPPPELDPSNWQAGIYEVSAVVEQGGVLRESNRLPVALAPRLNTIVPNVMLAQLVSVQVTASPPVRPEQSVVLLVGTRELLPDPFLAPASSLNFPAPAAPDALPSGPQWVRLRVDGVESRVIDYTMKPPEFDPGQQITVP